MNKLAVITAFGGINSAGRSSGHQGFKRMVLKALPQTEQLQTLNALAQLMGLPQHRQMDNAWREQIKQGSLVRAFDNVRFDPNAVPFHQPFVNEQGEQCWKLTHKRLAVQSGGQLPAGFDPANTYKSLHHPRGLQMAIWGISDALGQLGLPWDRLRQHVQPDQISVYVGSAMGQLDDSGTGGMMQASLLGKRTSAKQCALGLSEMPADFLNAYVLGNVGATGSMTGACASFLYNLKLGLEDIEQGRARIAVVGSSEAPLLPEVIEGYHAMTALASEQNLRALDGLNDQQTPVYQLASRPFAPNCGFSLSESAQFFVLCDDALALELGLSIYGSVSHVAVNADGFKKSISNPGIGNYLSMGKVLSGAEQLLGRAAIKHSFVQAHGSSTPANRTTESAIFSELAGVFGIEHWPICAVKAQLGHSLASASADQLCATLGSWATGILPGITTATALADDVQTQHLNILLQHQTFDAASTPVAFLNAKGFGGNNASAAIISPAQSLKLLKEKYDHQQWRHYWQANDAISERAARWDTDSRAGRTAPTYRFGEEVLEPEQLGLSGSGIDITGWEQKVRF